jgi:hypothetical protein
VVCGERRYESSRKQVLPSAVTLRQKFQIFHKMFTVRLCPRGSARSH